MITNSFSIKRGKYKISKIKNFITEKFYHKKLFALNFNCSLSLNYHSDDVCQVPSLGIIHECFLLSKFHKFSLILMCGNHSLNHEIKPVHERWLQLIYIDKKLVLIQSLLKINNIQKLAISTFLLLRMQGVPLSKGWGDLWNTI